MLCMVYLCISAVCLANMVYALSTYSWCVCLSSYVSVYLCISAMYAMYLCMVWCAVYLCMYAMYMY